MSTKVRHNQDTDNKIVELTPTDFDVQHKVLSGLSNIGRDVEDQPQCAPVFPTDALPQLAQAVINDLKASLNFPVPYTAGAMFFAIAVAAGNKFKLFVKTSWVEHLIFFITLIGRAGGNKSHPINLICEPLNIRDDWFDMDYKHAFKQWRADVKAGKEGAEQNEPVLRKLIDNNTTMEGLFKTLSNNPGSGVISDELVSFIGNLGRYSNGDDDNYLNTMFNGKSLKNYRKGEGQTKIRNAGLRIIGGIQPSRISELTKNGRSENGFTDRFLFFDTDCDEMAGLNDIESNPALMLEWQRVVNRLLDIPYVSGFDMSTGIETDNATIVKYTPEAFRVVQEWVNVVCRANSGEGDTRRSLYAKLTTYVHRVALLLQVFHYACHEKNDCIQIDADIAGKAVLVVKYFEQTAFRAREYAEGANDPTVKLTTQYKTLYNLLPDCFTSQDALTNAAYVGITQDTRVYEFLRRRELFEKQKRGEYKKVA